MSIFDEPCAKPIGLPGERYWSLESESLVGAPTIDEISYLHVIFAQTGFPYSEVPFGQAFQRRNGQAVIGLTPGYLFDPATGKLELQALPFGTIPRRLMLHINGVAIREQKKEIDLNRSMSRFIQHDLDMGGDSGGKTGAITRFREQMNRLTATPITIGMGYLTGKGGRGGATFKPAPAIMAYNVWDDDSLEGREKFNTTVVLSQSFFEGVMNHSIPLDDRAIMALGRSPLRLDTYFNWAQRLHRIVPGKVEKISYRQLHEQAGQEYSRQIDFVRKYRDAALHIKKVYPDANVDFTQDGIEFRHSKPPVPPRVAIQGMISFPVPPQPSTLKTKRAPKKRVGPDPMVGVWKGETA